MQKIKVMLVENETFKSVSGEIEAVFLKMGHGLPMVRPADETLRLRVGFGIEQDMNAHPMSPRQVLMTRAEDLRDFNIAPGELRENIVVAGLTKKEFSPGTVLTIRGGAQIRLTFYCEPCKRIGHLINSYRAIFERRGVLGVVLRSGPVRCKDAAYAQSSVFPALPSVPYERFLRFIERVPTGQVVTYKNVTVGMGVPAGYIRAIPNYIQRAGDNFPLHRILDSEGALLSYVPNQINRLKSEGVHVRRDEGRHTGDRVDGSVRAYVDLTRYAWSDSAIYTVDRIEPEDNA